MRFTKYCTLFAFFIIGPAFADGGAAESGWTEFRHSSGATLSHPADWRAVEIPEGIQLWPPDAGPVELVVVTGMQSGSSDPRAADVANYLDASMFQMLPGLTRRDPPRDVEAANGPGALYQYSGMFMDGSQGACDIYVTIENGVALSLSALAPPRVLASRSDTLEGIFSTLELGVPVAAGATAQGGTGAANSDDPRLVGMFAGESIASSSGVYVNTQLVTVLNADGTLYYGAQSHFNASDRDIDGNLKWTATGNTAGDVESGRWSASNGIITIRWDSGEQSVFAYGFEPDGTLVLRDPYTRELINFYSRVR
ncbi:MAG: hypothetical protein QNI99_04960 [Woeseiaceae bacterium]|nr:hypothetical protein [Woeseiaceae bacterium]